MSRSVSFGFFGSLVHTAVVLGLTGFAPGLAAQETGPPQNPPAIEDNSFFIEEAYNQEAGVVQHVSNFVRFHTNSAASAYSFTQEWPLRGQAHQLSYTLPYTWSSAGEDRGVGDVFVNYRYQLRGHDSWAALSPRLSLILPTGPQSARQPGVQVNLPASRRVNAWLVVHANAGATLLPGGRDRFYNVGASAVGLVSRNFNVMLEVISGVGSDRDESGRSRGWTETIVSPGVRWAIDVGSLQVVPGLAVPLRIQGGRTATGVFGYLSLEHPFR